MPINVRKYRAFICNSYHGSYKYSSIKFNDFSMTFPQYILTISGVSYGFETPIFAASGLQRFQIAAGEAEKKEVWGVIPKDFSKNCAICCI